MGLFGKKKAKAREAEADVVAEAEAEKAVGPYDEAEAPEDDELLECGALRLPPVEGATIQFTVERNREVVLGAVYIVGESALQLQVFAAPKSSDLWDDVRADMISSIASQGGSSREAEGDYGQEIHAQMPVEGSRTVNPVRYLGIDGPRWLLRATLTGRAAVDDAEARSLLRAVLDRLVVVRGVAAHPPRDILPLEVPRSGSKHPEPQRDRISLPRRGPEISEVR